MLILIKAKKRNSEFIPSNLFIWECKEFDDDTTPDIYTDIMDDIVENYNRIYTQFHFYWIVG